LAGAGVEADLTALLGAADVLGHLDGHPLAALAADGLVVTDLLPDVLLAVLLAGLGAVAVLVAALFAVDGLAAGLADLLAAFLVLGLGATLHDRLALVAIAGPLNRLHDGFRDGLVGRVPALLLHRVVNEPVRRAGLSLLRRKARLAVARRLRVTV